MYTSSPTPLILMCYVLLSVYANGYLFFHTTKLFL